MWTDKEIEMHSVFLDRQEELALSALRQGFRDLTTIERYVASIAGDCDRDFVESIVSLQTVPDGKVKLETI